MITICAVDSGLCEISEKRSHIGAKMGSTESLYWLKYNTEKGI